MKKNKILSMIIAAMTFSSMLSLDAGAVSNNNEDKWILRYVPGAPSSITNLSETYVDVADLTLTSMYEYCTSVSYCVSSTGQTSGARYHGYYEYTDNGKLYKKITFTSRRHNVSPGGGTVTYGTSVPKGHTYYILYTLEDYTPGSCYYYGNITY